VLARLRDFSKTYQSGEVEVKAVRGINLDIKKGDFVAIMGTSGSGKSTLMNMLGCLDKPTSGEYLLDGVNVAALSRRQLAGLRNKKLGFVFQSFNLLARTSALENVELPLLYNDTLITGRDREHHHPSQLSGGQQQRVAIARSLINRPEILLADEPTGNLDTRTSIDIMGLFQELNDSGITIVMVTHELDIAAYCKRIVIMRDGKIISDTPNVTRRVAADERAALDRAEQQADLT